MSGYNDQELDGSIVEGLTDKWPSEEKRKFMEDWENDSFLFEIDSDKSMEGLGMLIKLLSTDRQFVIYSRNPYSIVIIHTDRCINCQKLARC